MKRILFSLYLFVFSTCYSQTYTFTTTTTNAYNTWDSGNSYTGFTKSITVSGVPTSGYVLQQVNIYLGEGTNGSDLSLYASQLVAPNSNTITLFNTGYFYSTTFNKYLNIHLRDHSQLKRVVDYGGSYYIGSPYYYGYYRVETANSFTASPTDPNGTWTFQMKENTGSEMAFQKVELVFGPALVVTDIRASSTYDNCVTAQCMQTGDIFWGTNSGFGNAGANDPGLTVGGCTWNAAKNNSAWFYFTASATTANFSISGFSNYQESVALQMGGTGCGGPTFSLMQCPITQMFDPSAPTTTSSNNYWYNRVAWASGFAFNHEYSLTGLTIGQEYILIIDGQSANASDYYLEMKTGAANGCNVILPVTLIDFSATHINNGINLNWIIAEEKNVKHYMIERSFDGVNFTPIEESVTKPGNRSGITKYAFLDATSTESLVYYRLVAHHNDGNKLNLKIIAADKNGNQNKKVSIYPNPSTGVCTIKFSSEVVLSGKKYFIRNIKGALIQEGFITSTDQKIELQTEPGIYILESENFEGSSFQKIIIQPQY